MNKTQGQHRDRTNRIQDLPVKPADLVVHGSKLCVTTRRPEQRKAFGLIRVQSLDGYHHSVDEHSLQL